MSPRPENVPDIPFGTFGPQLDTLLEAMGNKLEREWPRRYRVHAAAQSVVLALTRVSQNTYKTIRFFAADEPPNYARKLEFALSISPLARTILDALATVVFLFGDLRRRMDWYVRSGWRELQEEHQRLLGRYGADPSWQEWLQRHRAIVDAARDSSGITASEVQSPSLIPWWPTPAQMKQKCDAAGDRREYLDYLTDWYYRSMSQEAHLSLPGLARRGYVSMPYANRDDEWPLRKFKSDSVLTTVILLHALISELELQCRFELRERIEYVWGIVSPHSDDARDLYDRFYRAFFQPLT